MPGAFRFRQAVECLLEGGVIAHPTEAVWGLACLPEDQEAVLRICGLKDRDPGKGMILVAEHADRFDALLAELPELARRRVLASWPGPNTWILPDPQRLVPDWVRGEHDGVAVRVTEHPLTAALCAAVDGPLISTSANPAGRLPARRIWQARRYFGAAVDCYLAGDTGGRRRPSVIRDALTGQVLRG
jgi:L-threonylcarbamoyladenylate synthase